MLGSTFAEGTVDTVQDVSYIKLVGQWWLSCPTLLSSALFYVCMCLYIKKIHICTYIHIIYVYHTYISVHIYVCVLSPHSVLIPYCSFGASSSNSSSSSSSSRRKEGCEVHQWRNSKLVRGWGKQKKDPCVQRCERWNSETYGLVDVRKERGFAPLCGVGVVARSWRGSVAPPRSLYASVCRVTDTFVSLFRIFFALSSIREAQPNLILSNLNLVLLVWHLPLRLYTPCWQIRYLLFLFTVYSEFIGPLIFERFFPFYPAFSLAFRNGAKLFKIWRCYFYVWKINTMCFKHRSDINQLFLLELRVPSDLTFSSNDRSIVFSVFQYFSCFS